MKRKVDKEFAAKIDNLLAELLNAHKNPKPRSEWTEEEKKIELIYRTVSESLHLGKYRFSEVVAHAKVNLGDNYFEYLRDLKGAYSAVSFSVSEEIFNNMDDMKTVREFKLDNNE